MTNPISWDYSAHSDLDKTEFRDKFKTMFNRYQKMLDQSISNDLAHLGDMLRFLPGVVVQKHMSMQGMTDLYRIKPSSLELLIKSSVFIEQLNRSRCIFDDYLSIFFARQRPFSALLLRSHTSTYFHLPSFFVFCGWIQCL